MTAAGQLLGELKNIHCSLPDSMQGEDDRVVHGQRLWGQPEKIGSTRQGINTIFLPKLGLRNLRCKGAKLI